MGRGKRSKAGRALTSQPSHFLSGETVTLLEEAIAALSAQRVPGDSALAAAQTGALSWGSDLVESMRELHLSAPLADLAAADSEEWWQVEGTLKNCAMQAVVLAALTGSEQLKQVAVDTRSGVYARHRQAVEKAL